MLPTASYLRDRTGQGRNDAIRVANAALASLVPAGGDIDGRDRETVAERILQALKGKAMLTDRAVRRMHGG